MSIKDRIFYYILIFFALISIIINFIVLDKGLITSDEGWYLVLLRDLPQESVTFFYMLFQNVFDNDIYQIRLCSYFLNIVGSMIFSAGLFSYVRSRNMDIKRSFVCIIFVFCCLGHLKIPCMLSLSYISLNLITVETSIGLLLLGLFCKKWNNLFFILSGFIIFFLCPIMITNMIIIALYIFLIFWFNKNPYKTTLLFMFGGGCFFLFYFCLIQNPKDYIENFIHYSETTVQKGSEDYGFIFLVKWLYRTIFQYFVTIIIVVMAILLYVKVSIEQKYLSKPVFYAVGVFIFLLWCWATDFLYSPNWIGLNSNLMWITVFIFICSRQNTRNDIVLFLFLCASVICLCFGSNVPFRIRNFEYHSLVTPIFCIVLFEDRKWIYRIILLVVVLCYSIKLWLNFYNGANWHGDVYKEQTEKLTSIAINQNLYVDKKIIENASFIRKVIPEKSNVLCHQNYWGYVDLLNLNPLDYNFLYTESKFLSFKKNDVDCYLILPNNEETRKLQLDTISNVSFYKNDNTIIYKNY